MTNTRNTSIANMNDNDLAAAYEAQRKLTWSLNCGTAEYKAEAAKLDKLRKAIVRRGI